MGIYDIAMLVIFLGAIVFGYWKGLAWQIASLAALVVSYIVAVNFRDQMATLLKVDEPWNKIGAMLILFLGTSLLIWAIYSSVSKSLKKNELKGFDRQAGAILGALKGGLLCMVVEAKGRAIPCVSTEVKCSVASTSPTQSTST